jgi:hypothetical protein
MEDIQHILISTVKEIDDAIKALKLIQVNLDMKNYVKIHETIKTLETNKQYILVKGLGKT